MLYDVDFNDKQNFLRINQIYLSNYLIVTFCLIYYNLKCQNFVYHMSNLYFILISLKFIFHIKIFSLFRAKSLRTSSNLFVVNLAFCDFFMMMKTPIFIYNSFNTGFATGHLGCQIFAFIGSLSGIGASMTNAAIAYDRYRYCRSFIKLQINKINNIKFINIHITIKNFYIIKKCKFQIFELKIF